MRLDLRQPLLLLLHLELRDRQMLLSAADAFYIMIAGITHVNVSAIVGYNSKPAFVRTVGDLTGVLMMLYKAHVLMIIGKPTFDDEDVNKDSFDLLEGEDPQKCSSCFIPC